MVPVVDGLIIATDESAKTITFDKNIFESVAVYEDWYTYIIPRDVWGNQREYTW